MGYRTLRECVDDLATQKKLVRIDAPVDPNLEVAEIQRRVFVAKGPALFFSNVIGCRFPMVGNLFGNMDRLGYIFRDALIGLKDLVELRMDPTDLFRRPKLFFTAPLSARFAVVKRVNDGPALDNETTLDQLPQLKSWPDDGGAFITLPQVYTEDPDEPGFRRSNLGMYRIQMSGNAYELNRQAGLHYQLHRGIAAHHAAAIRRGEKLPVNVFVGGPPSMIVAAVMPLPEGMSELAFAGVLGRCRVPMICRPSQLPISAEADFCIQGYIEPKRLLPEGPFGDHLGYYSRKHDFPVLHVERVTYRNDAIWPFTVVGRPPQEDSMFAAFIHELVGPVLPREIPGIRAVHAVEAAGVHPLLLAIGSERYVPFEEPRRPRELVTLANALLGHGQLSLAKYLWIVAGEDDDSLDVRQVAEFLRHALERVDWRRDLHFQTQTSIDTLDYSGPSLHEGSKVAITAAGPPRRMLPVAIDAHLRLPAELGFKNPRMVLPGILAVQGPAWSADAQGADAAVARFCEAYTHRDVLSTFPLVVVVDDSDFCSRSLDNFLWTTFTRSNPAADVYGIESFTVQKHWGCRGSLVIDARAKPHHAPPVIEDPAVSQRVDQLAVRGGPLHGIL